MMKLIFACLFFGFITICEAQDHLEWLKDNQTDTLYREDQFYAGFSFNFLTDLPQQVNQSGFSGGLIFGFIRDMPINKRRNVSIGLGLGFNLNTFGQTLKISRANTEDTFSVIGSDIDYDSNRFTTNMVQVPLELRWRTSDSSTFAFWRIYLGLNIGYVFQSKSIYQGSDESFEFSSPQGINNFRTSAKLTFGYGAVNFFVDASITPIFDETTAEVLQQEIGIKPIKVGLVFFFL